MYPVPEDFTSHLITTLVVVAGVGIAALYLWRTSPSSRSARPPVPRTPQAPKRIARPVPRKTHLKLMVPADEMDRQLNALLREQREQQGGTGPDNRPT
jgi:hypothetical protein